MWSKDLHDLIGYVELLISGKLLVSNPEFTKNTSNLAYPGSVQAYMNGVADKVFSYQKHLQSWFADKPNSNQAKINNPAINRRLVMLNWWIDNGKDNGHLETKEALGKISEILTDTLYHQASESKFAEPVIKNKNVSHFKTFGEKIIKWDCESFSLGFRRPGNTKKDPYIPVFSLRISRVIDATTGRITIMDYDGLQNKNSSPVYEARIEDSLAVKFIESMNQALKRH